MHLAERNKIAECFWFTSHNTTELKLGECIWKHLNKKGKHFLTIVISGAHLNPAVSLALACVGKFPWKSVLHYLPAQYLGAWLGSSLVLLTYKDAIDYYYVDSNGGWGMDTAGIFVTSPAPGVSNLGGAIDQVMNRILRNVLY